MSIRPIAEKEFRDSIRSRTLLIVVGLFTEFMAVLAYLFPAILGDNSQRSSTRYPIRWEFSYQYWGRCWVTGRLLGSANRAV